MISVCKEKKYWYEQICCSRNNNSYYRIDKNEGHRLSGKFINWGYVIAPHELGYWND